MMRFCGKTAVISELSVGKMSDAQLKDTSTKITENGPSARHYSENGNLQYEEYHIDGRWHRENGPAKIYYSVMGNITMEEYWVNGKREAVMIY
jgi:antitoxin component YwqK of YwqJK toxin-antitoxin module